MPGGHVDDGDFSVFPSSSSSEESANNLWKFLPVYDCFGAFAMKMFINTWGALLTELG